MTTAVVLFGHGSRDPAWRAPMDAVASRVAAAAPGTLVRCAFLELQAPALPDTVDDLAAQGVTAIRLLPMFLGIGKHAREDLPVLLAEIRARHPALEIEVLPAVGESPVVLDLLARLVLDVSASLS